jgi:hypothetical protein
MAAHALGNGSNFLVDIPFDGVLVPVKLACLKGLLPESGRKGKSPLPDSFFPPFGPLLGWQNANNELKQGP